MKNLFTGLIVTAAMLCSIQSQAQIFEWAKGVAHQPAGGSSTSGYCRDMVMDAAGNTYITGYFNGAATFETTTLNSIGSTDMFIAKFDVNGNMLWVQQAGDSGSTVFGYDIDIDAAGNAFVSGYFSQKLTIATGATIDTVSSSGSYDFYLAKFDSQGNLQWIQSGGGSSDDRGYGISVDPSGNCFMTGRFESVSMVIGNDTLRNGGGIDIFMAKFSPSGVPLWAQRAGSSSDDGGSRVQADGSGNCYFTGNMSGTSTFGSGAGSQTLTSSGDIDVYIAYVNATGSLNWVQKLGGTSAEVCNGMALGANNHLYITGEFGGTATFGTGAASHTLTAGNSFNSKIYLAKYDAAGVLQWAQAAGAVSNSTANTNDIFSSIAADQNGDSYLTGNFNGNATFGTGSSAMSLVSTTNDVFVAKYDATGALNWLRHSGGPLDQFGYGVQVHGMGDCYVIGRTDGPAQFGTIALPGVGGFLTKLKGEANAISGRVYLDMNGNGMQDAGETAYQHPVIFQLNTPDTSFYSSSNGRYVAYADTGSWQLAFPVVPQYHTLTQPAAGVYNGQFSSFNNTDSTRHFGIHPVAGIQDLRVTVSSAAAPRPGFTNRYIVTYANTGTTTTSGEVRLVKSSNQTVDTASVGVAVAGDTLIWTYQNLQPMQSRNLFVNLTLAATATLGDSVITLATVTPISGDTTPVDNVSKLQEQIIGSFDPNDKLVSTDKLTPTEIAQGKWLTYTVRFQNTGTASAINVRIQDTLSQKLNIASFQLLSASHPCQWVIRGDGALEFKFDNIMLPDSFSNEPASHGFVKYRVRPRTNLQLGEEITNQAHIYFDFNAPVATNIVSTRVQLILEREQQTTSASFALWPNPSTGLIKLKLNKGFSTGRSSVRILSLLGQEVGYLVMTGETTELDLRHLNKGIYLVQVQSGNSVAVERVVVMP